MQSWATSDYEEVVFTLGVVPCSGKVPTQTDWAQIGDASSNNNNKYPFWPNWLASFSFSNPPVSFLLSSNILDFMLNFHSSEAHINPFPALSTSHDITGSLAKCFPSAYRLLSIFLLQELSYNKHQRSTSAQLNLFLKLFLEWNCTDKNAQL